MNLHAIIFPAIALTVKLIGIKQGKDTDVKSVSSLTEKQKRKMLKEIQKRKAAK